MKDVNEALQPVPDALAYAVQAAKLRVDPQREIEQPRRRGISDEDLAAAIGRELRERGIPDDTIADLLKRIPEMRRQDKARGRTWADVGQTQVQRIANELHAESQSQKRGHGIGF